MSSLTTDQRLFIESQVSSRRKSMGAAYALWLFLGLLSMHRFYLERPGSAILQIILNCLVVGLIWTLIDAFLIPGMIRDHANKVRNELMFHADPGAHALPAGIDTSRWSKKDREAYALQQRLAASAAPPASG